MGYFGKCSALKLIRTLERIFCRHEWKEKYLVSYHFLSEDKKYSGYGNIFIQADSKYSCSDDFKETKRLIAEGIDPKVNNPNIIILNLFRL